MYLCFWLTSGGMWQEIVHAWPFQILHFSSIQLGRSQEKNFRKHIDLPAMRLKEAELRYSNPDSGTTVQALGWECSAHWVSSWYLCHPDEHQRTEAHPGRPDLFHWPRGFRAGHPPKSASPAHQWTAHSVQVGSLPWDCMPYFQNLQRNSAISQTVPASTPFFHARGPSYRECHGWPDVVSHTLLESLYLNCISK